MHGKALTLFLVFCWCFFYRAEAQLVNDGQQISVLGEGLIVIEGDYIHQSGGVSNQGTLKVKGNWSNFHSGSGVFNNASLGRVDFSGDKQIIGGKFKTVFPNVILSGTGEKMLSTDMDVAGELMLNEHELKVGKFTLSILNTKPEAIHRTSGFVSTDEKGKLTRSMAGGTYLFPLGSSSASLASQNISIPLYRPITAEADNFAAGPNTFSAGFIPEDADKSSYFRNSKRQDVKSVFSKYFYILSQDFNASSRVKFYQNSGQEADFRQLISWNRSFGLWEKAAPSTGEKTDGAADLLDRRLLFTSMVAFKDSPFSFADLDSSNPDLAPDPLTFFNAFSPDGDGKNDTWVVKNLDIYPDNNLTIFNRWGDEVYKASGYCTSKAWDGGSLNSGTYYYVLNVVMNGQKKTYKGFISMIKKD